MTNKYMVKVRPAGFFSRSVAFLIDLVILSLSATFIVFMISEIINFFGLTNYVTQVFANLQTMTIFTRVFISLLYYIYSLLYFSFFWSLIGSTPGKLLLGLRIISINGRRIGFLRGIIRGICYYISALLIFMGFIMIIFDKNRQGLHDKIAGTLVIYT